MSLTRYCYSLTLNTIIVAHRSNCTVFHKAISYEHAVSLGADVCGSGISITRSQSVPTILYRDSSLDAAKVNRLSARSDAPNNRSTFFAVNKCSQLNISITIMIHFDFLSDLSSGRRPMSKSDEKSKCIIIVIEIWRCENFSFAVHRYNLSEHDSRLTHAVCVQYHIRSLFTYQRAPGRLLTPPTWSQ